LSFSSSRNRRREQRRHAVDARLRLVVLLECQQLIGVVDEGDAQVHAELEHLGPQDREQGVGLAAGLVLVV